MAMRGRISVSVRVRTRTRVRVRVGSGPLAGSGLGLGFHDGSRSIRLRVSGASLVKPSKALAAPVSSREENWL